MRFRILALLATVLCSCIASVMPVHAAKPATVGTQSLDQSPLYVPMVTYPLTTPASPAIPTSPLKSFWDDRSFAAGTLAGLNRTGSGDGTNVVMNPTTLRSGTDTSGRYNGGTYWWGHYTSPVVTRTFKEAVISWQGNTPQNTWLDVELRARVGSTWTKWYSLGVWHEAQQPFRRHSVNNQGDAYANVSTDILLMKQTATAVQSRVTMFTTNRSLTPTLRSYAISFTNGMDQAGIVPKQGLQSNLAVPKRSQMIYPNGGNVWCSPTSTSMVMAYWGERTKNASWIRTVPTVKDGVWDYVYNGGGNWVFNTAYASAAGLESKVVRMSSLAEVEHWTAAGVPVIVSLSYAAGELDNAPNRSSGGHLMVVRGFDANGNVLANDPAASTNEGVSRTYNRLQFEKIWLKHSNGATYLIYPPGWKTPVTNGHW